MRGIVFILLSFITAMAQADRSGDIRVPVEVLDKIKSEYGLNKEKPLKIVFVDLFVSFKGSDIDQTKTVGASQRVLDLASIITARHKNFKMMIAPTEDLPGQSRMFFISQYEPITVGNNIFGMECGQSLVFNKRLAEFGTEGVPVSNFSSHYIHVLGGDYLLTALEGTTLRVGYFKLRDGRLLQKLCRVGS